MIVINELSLQRGSKILLNSASVRLHDGQRIGLIGKNGCGKSTFFQLLSGQLSADGGDCQIPQNWRIGYMRQETGNDTRLALDFVLDGDQKLRDIQRQIDQTPADKGEQLAHLYGELETIDGYTAEARAQELLRGLGFAPGDGARPVTDFSGGWRIRLNLAQTLMCPADLLLLDEPTNHLDLDTTWWLEQRLEQFRGTLIIISHDRDFLDNTVNHIVQIDQQQLHLFSGGYSAFERQRSEQLAQQQQMFVRQQRQIESIEKFVNRFRAKATKARQAQSRLKALERMQLIAPAHVDSPFQFSLPCAEKTSQPLLTLQQAVIGYDDKTILEKVDLRIEPDSRLGLLGPNGAGKSTLLKALIGEISPQNGQRVSGEHLAVGYFNQHQLEALDLSASSAMHLQRSDPKASEQSIRNFLGGFGFHGDRAFEVITHFSGGEKARLALALIAWQRPNLLVLDEPTNHLDLEMREALTMALQTFPGAVLLISHDRHLMRNCVDEFLLVADGSVSPFDGDLDDYHQWLEGRQKNASTSAPSGAPSVDRKAERKASAAAREKLQPLRKEIRKRESDVEKLQSRLNKLEEKLADTSLYEDENKDKLQEHLKAQGELRQQLESVEEEWFELQQQLEDLTS